MKAYMVFAGCPIDGCILVYAERATKARSIGYAELFSWDYVETSATRKPEFDKYYSGKCIIVENSELPEGVEFYTEIDCW